MAGHATRYDGVQGGGAWGALHKCACDPVGSKPVPRRLANAMSQSLVSAPGAPPFLNECGGDERVQTLWEAGRTWPFGHLGAREGFAAFARAKCTSTAAPRAVAMTGSRSHRSWAKDHSSDVMKPRPITRIV